MVIDFSTRVDCDYIDVFDVDNAFGDAFDVDYVNAIDNRINWKISPELKTYGISNWGFSLLEGSFITLQAKGVQYNRADMLNDEGGNEDGEEVTIEERIMIDNTWNAEFIVEGYSLPDTFSPKTIDFHYGQRKITIRFNEL